MINIPSPMNPNMYNNTMPISATVEKAATLKTPFSIYLFDLLPKVV